MPQYDFQSPGAGVANTIQKILLAREVAKRQAMLDDLNKRNVESQIQDRVGDRELKRVQMDNVTANTQAVNADRELRTAVAVSDALPKGAKLDESTMKALGPLAGSSTEVSGGVVPEAQGEGPMRDITFKGGMKDREARIAAEERAALEQAKAAERADIEAGRRDDRAAAAQSSADLRRELQSNQIASTQAIATSSQGIRTDAAAEKKADAQKASDQKIKVVRNMANEALGTIDQLLDDKDNLQPGVSEIVGTMKVPGIISRNIGNIPGIAPHAADKQATLDRLHSLLVVDLISEMKSQSRTGATGFGALNAPELSILENGAAALGQAQSEEAFRAELKRIREKLKLIMVDAPGSGGTTTTTATTTAPTGPVKSKYPVSVRRMSE